MIPNNRELAQLWQRILRGDTHAFTIFVDQHKNLVTSIAYSLTGDLSGSEDIAQETFLVSWQSRHELAESGKVVPWLSAIARNLAKQWVRKRSAKSWAATDLDSTDLGHEGPHPSERLVSDEEQQLVWSALESIPENYREVMILYYRESHSLSEVALALEITEDAARQRLSRGRNLLRAEVERTIESALARTRPSAHFTTGVMSLIAVGTGSTVAKAATTATAGLLGKTAAQSTMLAATQTAASGAALGVAGGLLGVLGGLAGTWLGSHVPPLMAPTMTERKLLEQEGRFIWRLSLAYMVVILASVGMLLILGPTPDSILLVVLGSMLMGVLFGVTCIVRGIRMSRKVKVFRETIRPEDDPNPTWLKDRMGFNHEPLKSNWGGRRFTSQRRLLGWPLYDFQVSDPVTANVRLPALHAKGWLAVGDKATGFLAIGGLAKGIFAFGGLAMGIVSFGGLSVGLLSIGGLALGGLSLGGLAVGHSAIGGGAIGWQATGGGALGIYSANGGLAIAGTIAEGGLALSLKYAVGGDARAPEANSDAAREECRKSWMSAYLNTDSIVENPNKFRSRLRIYATFLPVLISVLIASGVPVLMYRKLDRRKLE